MKEGRKFIELVLIMTSCIFMACTKEIIPEITTTQGYLDYFNMDMTFPCSGGEKTLYFTTNVDWTITMSGQSSSWCKVSQSSGNAGSFSVSVSVDANSDFDNRTAELVLTAQTASKTVTISQDQKNGIVLTKDQFVIGKDGGNIDIDVNSNVDYAIFIPEQYKKWIYQEVTKSLSSSKLTLTIGENENYEQREGEIYLRYGDMSSTVNITQNGGARIIAEKSTYDIAGKESTLDIPINCNTTYNVSTSVDWIKEIVTRSMSTSTSSFSVSANLNGTSRSGNITFTTDDGKESCTVTVNQSAVIKAKALDVTFTNTSGTVGSYLYIGKEYTFTVSASPSNAETDYEWKVADTHYGTINGNGETATLTTKDFGSSAIVVTDKYTGISSSYDFSTAVTNFAFNETSREYLYGYPVIMMAVGDKHQLKYTCTPSSATGIFRNLNAFNFKEYLANINTYVIVDNSSIVDIDENGLVTAKSLGTTIINANNGCGVCKSGSNDGVVIKVVEEVTHTGTIAGHEYVDLGLPSGKVWSTSNLGAFSETSSGAYYMWSNVDRVSSAWGTKWSTPTISEFRELVDYCSYVWTTKDGVSGYLFTGPNGAKLFLPGVGFRAYTEGYGYSSVKSNGSWALYWTSSSSDYSWEGQTFAYVLSGSSGSIDTYSTYNTTFMAMPIRPISR